MLKGAVCTVPCPVWPIKQFGRKRFFSVAISSRSNIRLTGLLEETAPSSDAHTATDGSVPEDEQQQEDEAGQEEEEAVEEDDDDEE